MPGLDGLELARRLRDETRVPFVFFSAYGDDDFVERAVEIGALGYLVKPLSIASILPMIRTALARAQDISGLEGALQEQPHHRHRRRHADACRRNGPEQRLSNNCASAPAASAANWKMSPAP